MIEVSEIYERGDVYVPEMPVTAHAWRLVWRSYARTYFE